jgi:hypothetical protein
LKERPRGAGVCCPKPSLSVGIAAWRAVPRLRGISGNVLDQPELSAAATRLRDADVSDLPPNEIAAVIVLAFMMLMIIVGLLAWFNR